MTIRNQYDVGGFEEWQRDTLSFRWLGAKVEFTLLGQRVIGEICEVDDVWDTLTAEFRDSGHMVTLSGSYQVFRKVE